jgi:hypothetical protein
MQKRRDRSLDPDQIHAVVRYMRQMELEMAAITKALFERRRDASSRPRETYRGQRPAVVDSVVCR